jgi:hypothetical protein
LLMEHLNCFLLSVLFPEPLPPLTKPKETLEKSLKPPDKH